MRLPSFSQSSELFYHPSPIWLRWCSTIMFVSAIVFLWLSLFVYNFHAIFGAGLVRSLVVALGFATFLNVYSFWYLHREHRDADTAFRATDCESLSIFQNVFDGILIVDNEGACLDANPAAAAILRIPVNKLIGHNIGRFLSDRNKHTQGLHSILKNKARLSHVRLVAGDGTPLFVDCSAAANYLPGRHVLIFCDVTERTDAELSLRRSEERFEYMANNIQELFWMFDAARHQIAYVNPAYSVLTGHSIESLKGDPSMYRDLIYPGDRIRVLSRLHELARFGTLDEEFRFVRADGEVRWAWAKGVSVFEDGEPRWLVGTAQDITSRKRAETKINEQLDAVETARAETEALRKSTLALSQNLAMDSVLDTLLHCISDLIPFDKATVLFVEDGADLMVAREAPRLFPKRIGLTLNASQNIFLQRILFEKRATLLTDVAQHSEWKDVQPLDHLQSWLGIPLVAAGNVLGILSLGTNASCVFTTEHLRLAKSLAVPAAVAIQNARTHERAEIYAAELEARLHELRETQKALKHSGGATP
jgi:PAS domain S-box-containing protein